MKNLVTILSNTHISRKIHPLPGIVHLIILLSTISLTLATCSIVPITGRQQLSLVSDAEILSLSNTQYEEFLEEHPLSKDAQKTAMIKRAGRNISTAIEDYFAEQGWSDQIDHFEWEYNLIEDDTPNAWCMPGGKIVFYTGILPITQDENGVAVVMGHEIAHAVAKHGRERMSQQIGLQFGAMALSTLLSEKPQQTQDLYMAAYGVTAQVGMILPYSRKHEYEADRLGLIFMAIAGYDPSSAVEFWSRMAELSKGAKPPVFLSTHPSDEERIKQLRKFLPEAMEYYNK